MGTLVRSGRRRPNTCGRCCPPSFLLGVVRPDRSNKSILVRSSPPPLSSRRAIADALATDPSAQGVAVCGTGIGISIALNRHSHIRAALVQDVTTATLTRLHNDANVIAFGDRVIGVETAKDALTAFLTTAFEGGRHQRRVEKLTPAN